MTEILEALAYGPVRALPAQNLASAQVLLPGRGRLYGWSFRESGAESGLAAEGSAVAPAAGATVASIAAVPAGLYLINWTVELSGAAAAADLNNFGLYQGATLIAQSVNLGAAGEYVQGQVEVTLAASQAITVKAIGAGTAGVTYAAQISVIPAITAQAILELQDGNQPLAEISAAVAGTLTQWFGPQGIDFLNQIKAVPVAGLMTGAVYAAFYRP